MTGIYGRRRYESLEGKSKGKEKAINLARSIF